MAEERGLGRVGRWKRAGAMGGKELMPQEVEASLTLGGAADLEGIRRHLFAGDRPRQGR